jgi:prepilin-type N-terminal cleavage/methylation domain-containing protein
VDAAAETQRLRYGRGQHMQLSGGGKIGGLQRGFTLLEVLIAAILLVIALVGSLALTIGLLRGNESTRARDTAYFLAQQVLDQYSATPVLDLPALLPGTAAPTAAPICYDMSDGAFVDHPVACGAVATTFAVRTVTCCVGPGVPLSPAPAAGCGILLATNPVTPLPPNVNFSPTSQGVSCLVEAEVTWPAEPATATASQLFVDTSNAPKLNFQNHVLLNTVRAQ